MIDSGPRVAGSPPDPELPLVIRGGVAVDAPRDDTRKDITALLALGLRLENVGVFLGAGASCGAGGKVMADILAALKKASPKTIEWLRQEGFHP